MCFAPQRRAHFRRLNFKKWSEAGVFWTFWLGNVLRATTARTVSTAQLEKVVRTWCALYIFTWKCALRHTFSTSELRKVVRGWCVLHILTWKCASRHNGVHFFNLSTSKSVLNDFPTFSRTCIFLLPTLSLLWPSHFLTSPPWLFHTLPTSAFPSVHIVGSLTSELPSIGLGWLSVYPTLGLHWTECNIFHGLSGFNDASLPNLFYSFQRFHFIHLRFLIISNRFSPVPFHLII